MMGAPNNKITINLLAPEVLINPFPTYQHLRENEPVAEVDPGRLWAVSSYRDVEFILKNHELFSSSAYQSLFRSDHLQDTSKSNRFTLTQDPPEHTKYHTLVAKAFVGKVIKNLEPMIRKLAESLISDIETGVEIDFLDRFSSPYIGSIVKHIVGTHDKQDHRVLREWKSLEEQLTPSSPPELVKAFETCLKKQIGYFEEVIVDRRKSPQDDLATALVHAESEQEQLTDSQICDALVLLTASSFNTSLCMFGNAMLFLSRNQEIFRQLKNDTKLIPAFTHELLRYNTPLHSILRSTTTTVELSGVKIPEGALVLVMLASANRDASRFTDPDTFQLHRPNAKDYISFGRGIHKCIGEPLARLEFSIALEAIVSKFDSLTCPPDSEIEWARSLFLRSLVKLPTTFK